MDTRGPNLGPRDTNFASVHIVPLPAIRVENVEKVVILYILNRLLQYNIKYKQIVYRNAPGCTLIKVFKARKKFIKNNVRQFGKC